MTEEQELKLMVKDVAKKLTYEEEENTSKNNQTQKIMKLFFLKSQIALKLKKSMKTLSPSKLQTLACDFKKSCEI